MLSNLMSLLTSLFSATVYEPSHEAWIFGSMFSQAGLFFVNLWQIICTGFYWVCKWLLALVDFLQYFIQKLIGLDYWLSNNKYTLDGATSNDLLFNFLFNDTVQKVFRAMLGLFFVLLIIFTIFAIVKQEWSFITGNSFGDGKGNSKGQIIRGSLKAIALVLVFPIVLCAGIISSNAILASLIKALSIDMSSTFGNTLFYASSLSANRYRLYANNGYRSPVSDTVSFYVITDSGGDGSAYANDVGKVVILGNSSYRDNRVVSVSSYAEYLSILPYCTKYSVDSMINQIIANNEKSFNGYCIRLNVGGSEKFFMVKVSSSSSTTVDQGRGFVNTKEAWYYYLRNVLQVPILNSSSDGDLGKRGLISDINGNSGNFSVAVGSDRCYISGLNLTDIEPYSELETACANTWDYPTIYEKNIAFDLASNYTVLRSGDQNWSNGGQSTSLLSYLMGHTNITNARLYYNSNSMNGYFDGGQLGFNTLKSEYYVMADVVDFMLENKLELYMLDSTSEIIDWNYGSYSIDQRWTNSNSVTIPESFSNKTTNSNDSSSKNREVKPFVVSYSEKCGDEFGNALYLADYNGHSELYGSVFIMCIKVNENKFIPLVNGKAYRDTDGNSYTFRSNYYSSNYNGVVIAKGTFTTQYGHGKENKPTYLANSENVAYGNLSTTPYYYDIVKTGNLAQYADVYENKVNNNTGAYLSDANLEINGIRVNNSTATLTLYQETDSNSFFYNKLSYKLINDSGEQLPITASTISNLEFGLVSFADAGAGMEYTAKYAGENYGSWYLFNCDGGKGFFIVQVRDDVIIPLTMNEPNSNQVRAEYTEQPRLRLANRNYNLLYDYNNNNIHITNNTSYTSQDNHGGYIIFGDQVNSVNASYGLEYNGTVNGKYLYKSYDPIDITTEYKENQSGILEQTKHETTYFNVQFDERLVTFADDGEYIFLNFANPTNKNESVQESIFYTLYLYNYNTAAILGQKPDGSANDIKDAKLQEIEWTDNGPSLIKYPNGEVPIPTDDKFVLTFKINSDFSWDKDSTMLALYDGNPDVDSNYVGTIYKSSGVEVTIDNLNSVSTYIYTKDYENYSNIRVANAYSTSEEMVAAYTRRASSLVTYCVRDNETYTGVLGEFHYKPIFKMKAFLKFMPINVQKEVTIKEFKITEGINFDYFFDGAYDLEDFYQASKINYIIIIFASALIIKILGTALWGVIKRFYEITLYFLATPAVASTIPLDNGSRFTRSIQQPLISKVMGTYGIMLGINMFFVLLVPVRSMSNIFTAEDIAQSGSYFLKKLSWILSPEILNLYVYILFLLVAFTLINTLPKTISDMLDLKGGDVVASGKETKKQVADDMKSAGDFVSGKSAIEGTKKAVKGAAAAIPGGALVKGAFGVGKKGVDKVRNRNKKAHENAQDSDDADEKTEAKSGSSRDDFDTSAENGGGFEGGSGGGSTGGDGGANGEGGGVAGAVGDVAGGVANAAVDTVGGVADAIGDTLASENESAVMDSNEFDDLARSVDVDAVKNEDGTINEEATLNAQKEKLAQNLALGIHAGEAPKTANEAMVLNQARNNSDVMADAVRHSMMADNSIEDFKNRYGLAGYANDSKEVQETIGNMLKNGTDKDVNTAINSDNFDSHLSMAASKAAKEGNFKVVASDLKNSMEAGSARTINGDNISHDDFAAQSKFIGDNNLVEMLQGGGNFINEGSKNAVLDKLGEMYNLTDETDENLAHQKAAKTGYVYGSTEYNQAYMEELERRNKAKIAAGYGQKQEILLGMINDSDYTMQRAEKLYKNENNGKELKYASESERNRFLLDNFGDNFEKKAEKEFRKQVSDPEKLYVDMLSKDEKELNDAVLNGTGVNLGMVLKDMSGSEEEKKFVEDLKQDYFMQHVSESENGITMAKDVSKMSDAEKQQYNYNLNMLQQQSMIKNNSVLQNIFNNTNIFNKDEINAEIEKIKENLKFNNNLMSDSTAQWRAFNLYMNKHSDVRNELLGIAASDVTLALDDDKKVKLADEAIKSNSALNAEYDKQYNGILLDLIKKDDDVYDELRKNDDYWKMPVEEQNKYLLENYGNTLNYKADEEFRNKMLADPKYSALIKQEMTKNISANSNATEADKAQFFASKSKAPKTQFSSRSLSKEFADYYDVSGDSGSEDYKGVVKKIKRNGEIVRFKDSKLRKKVDNGGNLSVRAARKAAMAGDETAKLRVQNELVTAKANVDKYMDIFGKNFKDKDEFRAELTKAFGENYVSKMLDKKNILGASLGAESISIQQYEIMRKLQSDLRQASKRAASAAPYISSDPNVAKEYAGKKFQKATDGVISTANKVHAEKLSNALALVNSNTGMGAEKLKEMLNKINPDALRGFNKRNASVADMKDYLTSQLGKVNAKIKKEDLYSASTDLLKNLNGTRVDKNDVMKAGMASSIVKQLDKASRDEYAAITKQAKSVAAAHSAEKALNDQLKANYDKLSNEYFKNGHSAIIRAQMRTELNKIAKSTEKLNNLEPELQKALQKKADFESKYAAKQIKAAKVSGSGSKVAVSSNAKVTDRYDFFTKGGQKVAKGSVTERQVEKIARDFVMQNKANLERMVKSLNDKTQADLKQFVRRATSKLSSDFGANINTLKNVQRELESKIKSYSASSDKNDKQMLAEIKNNKRRADKAEKELIDKLKELGIEISDIKLK